MFDLFGHLSQICEDADQLIVLMIDEVDSAANNQVFLDFLAQLRGYYIDRDESPIFHSGILADYEKDSQTGMNIQELAALIYDYTSGYPFLVSKICKLIDEKIKGEQEFPDQKAAWTKEGFLAAVRILLLEENTLFESLDNKLMIFQN